MINVTKTPNYETLKAEFKDGIEYKMTPFKTYFKKKLKSVVNPSVDKEVMANVVKGLYTDDHKSLIMQLKGTACVQPDWNRVAAKIAVTSYAEKLTNDGYSIISDTFNRGRQNPCVCFMAWYDAIAEYVLSAANNFIGEKAPIPFICEQLNNINKNILKEDDFRESKANVYESLKTLYPKTYKKRIKLIEKSYNTRIQNGVTKIVRELIN